MDGILILPHECIICLGPCFGKKGNPPEIVTQPELPEPGPENPKQSIFKLLNLNLEYSEDEYRNLFCGACETRNYNIFELFSKMTSLQNELKVLRTTIEVDFRSCWETLKAREDNTNPACDVLSQTKQHICSEIAKRLHYEPDQSVDGDNGWLDPSELLDCEAEFFENDTEEFDVSTLKQIHRIKDISIVVQKFPQHLLRYGRINVRRIPPKYRYGNTRKLTGRRTGVPGQSFRCTFVDCPSKFKFASEIQRDNHMKQCHDIEMRATSKSAPRQKGLVTVKSSMDSKSSTENSFACSFPNCSFPLKFSSKKELDLHGKISHGSNSSSSNNFSGGLNVPKIKMEAGIKCIFADCTSNTLFTTVKERDDHVVAVHEVSTSSPHSGFKCIFVDCTAGVTFNTSAELDEHVRLEHEVDDVKVSLQKKRGRGRPPTAAKLKQPVTKLISRRRPKRSKPVSVCEDSSDESSDNQDDTFEPDHTVSSEDESNEQGKSFKCIFADCSAQAVYKSKEERDKHVAEEHEIHQEESAASNINDTEGNTTQEDGSDAPQKFKCVFADCRDFDTVEARNEHVKTEHQGFKALKTMKTVTKPTRLKIIESGDPKANLFCVIEGCPRKKIFPSEADLKMHMKQCHEGLTHPYKCTGCDRYFAKKGQRAEHYRVKHLNLKPFMCHFCGAAFSSTPNLKRHLVRHTNEKNYKCAVCQKEFKTTDGRRIHMRYAHTGERPYSCDRCGKGFVTHGHLVKHMKCVHNPTHRPHVCHLCGKSFPIHGYLHMHIKNSHEGVRRKRIIKPRPRTSKPRSLENPQTDTYSGAPIPEVENSDNSSHSSPYSDQYVPSVNPPTEFNFQQQAGNSARRTAPEVEVDYHTPRGNPMDLSQFHDPRFMINQSDVSRSVFSHAVGMLNPDLMHLNVPPSFKNLHAFYPGQDHFTGDSSSNSNTRF